MCSVRAARIIKAPRHAVYAAFLDAATVARWLPPTGMTAVVHAFEPRADGAYHLSLRYQAPDGRPEGKTSGDTDTFRGRFVALVTDARIVQAGSFVTEDLAYAGEMTISWDLTDSPGGTRVTVTCENAPADIRPEDHEKGLTATLANLAAFVE